MRNPAPGDASPHQCRRATLRGTLASVTPQDRKAGNLPHSNLAARAGRWSAQHRKTAVLGWLAFVAIAFVIGGMVGTKTLAPEEQGNGSSQRADQARADAFPKEASESVLVQAKGDGKATDPAFRAAVDDVAARLAAAEERPRRRVPVRQGQRGPDLRGRALRARELQGARATWSSPRSASTPRWPPSPPPRRRIPSCASSSSATPPPPRRSTRSSRRTSSAPRRSRCRSRC